MCVRTCANTKLIVIIFNEGKIHPISALTDFQDKSFTIQRQPTLSGEKVLNCDIECCLVDVIGWVSNESGSGPHGGISINRQGICLDDVDVSGYFVDISIVHCPANLPAGNCSQVYQGKKTVSGASCSIGTFQNTFLAKDIVIALGNCPGVMELTVCLGYYDSENEPVIVCCDEADSYYPGPPPNYGPPCNYS